MSDPPKKNARLSRRVVGLMITGVVMASLVLLALWRAPPPFPPPGQSGANGYPELLEAATKLAPRTGFYDQMELGDLAAIVEQNRAALEMARQALRKTCWVTFGASKPRLATSSHSLKETNSLRELARAFAAAAKHARATGHPDEAFQWGWDIVRLAEATGHGGVVLDQMMANAIHGVAMQALTKQVAPLSRDDCTQWQETLTASPWKQDDPQDVWRREMAYLRHQHGQLQMLFMARTLRAQRQTIVDQLQTSHQRQLALRAILHTHVALRAYQLDHQQFPATLDPLVPEYLPQLPADPFSQGPLKYLPQGDSYALYSVGENGTDDQSVESPGNEPDDILLDIAPE